MPKCLFPYYRIELDPWEVPPARALVESLGEELYYDVFGDLAGQMDDPGESFDAALGVHVWTRDEMASLRRSLDGAGCHPRVSEVRCRDCATCLESHAQFWSMRFEHETERHRDLDNEVVGEFMALTFAPEHLPRHGLLPGRDPLVAFLRELRERYDPIRTHPVTKKRQRRGRFSFIACGEYGTLGGRPHYHVALLGKRWDDAQRFPWPLVGRQKEEDRVFSHPELQELWPYGQVRTRFIEGGAKAAAYVAKYALKGAGFEVTAAGRRRDLRRERGQQLAAQVLVPAEARNSLLREKAAAWKARGLDLQSASGRLIALTEWEKALEKAKPFIFPISKPGIGLHWLRQHYREVYPSRGVYIGEGKYVQPPPAYDRAVRKWDPPLWTETLKWREERRRELGEVAYEEELRSRRILYADKMSAYTLPRDLENL